MSFFCTSNNFGLKNLLFSDISIAISALFLVLLTCYVFFHPFTFHLFMSFNLVESCFCTNFCLLIGICISFASHTITDKVGFASATFYSASLMSFLFLCSSITAFFSVKYFIIYHFNSLISFTVFWGYFSQRLPWNYN